MAEACSVIVVSDYTKTRNTMRAALAEAADCHCAVECVDRDEFNKRRIEIQASLTRVVFAFPRQERYLIYDKSDPYNTLQREIDAVGIDRTMIFVQYKEDVDDATLIHSDLVKLLQYGAQKDLLPYLKQGRVLSLKEQFNAYQWTQIESLFNIPIKEEIKRRKERIQLEKELAGKKKTEKEEEERQKKQTKAIKDEALSKEDDEQPKPESLEEVHIPGEEQLKELIRLLEKIPKDKFINQCIDHKSLQLQLPWKYKSSHFKKHIKDHLQQQLQILSKDVLEVLEQITGAFLAELTAALEKKTKK